MTIVTPKRIFGNAPDMAGVITALQGAIDTLGQQLEQENTRATRAEIRAEQVEARQKELRERLQALEAELQQAKQAALPKTHHQCNRGAAPQDGLSRRGCATLGPLAFWRSPA